MFSILDSSGSIAVLADQFNSTLVILKRDSDGFYNLVEEIEIVSAKVTTNGQWVASVIPMLHTLFKLNDDGTVAQNSTLNLLSVVSRMMADGSYVVVLPMGSIETYEYDADTQSWILARNDSFPGITFDFALYPYELLPITESTIISWNMTSEDEAIVRLFSRQADKSWTLVDSFKTGSPYINFPGRVFWDGADTIIKSGIDTSANSYPSGQVTIFKKSQGTWSLDQVFNASDFDVAGVGFFGVNAVQINEDNYLFTASYDGFFPFSLSEPDFNVGSACVLHRNTSGKWEFTAKVFPEKPGGIFGAGLAKNDFDVIIVHCPFIAEDRLDCLLQSVAVCFTDPIDATCATKQLDSCSPVDLDLATLFTVNNPTCGEVTAAYSFVRINDDAVSIDLALSRTGVSSLQCTATLTCPSASVSSAPLLAVGLSLVLVLLTVLAM